MPQLIDTTDMKDAGYRIVSAKMNADSLTDSAWQGATWTLPAGRAVNTPATVGEELLTNPSFDVNVNDWTPTDCTLASIAGGYINNCCEMTRTGGSKQFALFDKIISIGFYRASAYVKSGSAGNVSAVVGIRSNTVFNGIIEETKNSSADWVNFTSAGLIYEDDVCFRIRKSDGTPGTILFDEASWKQLSTATLPRIIPFSTQYFTTCKAGWTIGTGLQAGVVCNLDSLSTPANFVLAIHNRTNAQLWKCVAGTYTKLVDEAATYGADRLVEIRRPSDNTYQLYYHGSQVGIDKTISDAGIIDNKLHGLFSTGDGNSAANFTFTGA